MDFSIGHVTDRRRVTRVSQVAEHGVVQARVRPGYEALVVNISAHGALIETPLRLLPGRPVELRLEVDGRTSVVCGRVLRCAVVRVLSSRVSYHGAVGFEQPLAWLVARANPDEYSVLATSHIERAAR